VAVFLRGIAFVCANECGQIGSGGIRVSDIAVLSSVSAGLGAIAAAYCARLIVSRSALKQELQRQIAAANAMREAKDAAAAASRAKTDFLASMSHELRTPLNAVIGFSEILAQQTFGPLGQERYRDYAKDIHASGSHLLDIINDILDVAKAESGTFELAEATFDSREPVMEAAKMLRQRIWDAGLTLELRLPACMPLLHGDRRRITQIFLNLITNAVKFTPGGGKITIGADCDEEFGLAFTVRDTGIGIAQENLMRVLQPFVQVGGISERKEEGTGLGLPLVDMMIRAHGGRLELESEPAKGTTARVIFPLQRLGGYDAAGAERGPTVLVVDDDENPRKLIARILSRGGFRIVTATDGVEALKCFRSQPVDLVLTDMGMPVMDGAELLSVLKLDRPGVPVIAMSGALESVDRLRNATDVGACATLSKPFAASQLLQAVRESLNRTPLAA
jgi:signal transduction histidine kinase/CheY-like chemotaxis protein